MSTNVNQTEIAASFRALFSKRSEPCGRGRPACAIRHRPGFAASVPCAPPDPAETETGSATRPCRTARCRGAEPDRNLCDCLGAGAANFRALLHRRVRSVDCRCRSPTPYPSMGFVPLQGSFLPPPLQRRTQGAVLLRPSLRRFLRNGRTQRAAVEVCSAGSSAAWQAPDPKTGCRGIAADLHGVFNVKERV
jgi:hypothetical protein